MRGAIFACAMLMALGAAAVELKTECAKPGPWKISVLRASAPAAGGVEEFEVRLTSLQPSVPPEFDVYFDCAPNGAHSLWTPIDESSERSRLYASEWGKTRYKSELAHNEPICCAFDEGERNALAIACSEAMRCVKYAITCRSTDAMLHGRFKFFSKPEAPRTDYSVRIRVDRREVFWADAVREGSAWIAQAAGLKPCRVPEAAFEPFYSSWYAFWQDVHDADIVREAKAAAALGMTGMILDDGWQKEDSKTYYSATGDWMPVKSRFPDMRAHVDKVHAAGIRNYLLWLSVPFVGNESKAFARFKGKFLWGADGDTAALDPRFPEVREYLIMTYERCVRDWDFDGLKLDFIDAMATDDDPAVKENYAGRDCKTIPEGIDRLMTEVHDRLAKIKPDVLIEFRQRYTGPAIRRYGNLLRATDCPYDILGNRKRIADLRLTSGATAVHADMLVWNPDDTPEAAARVILDALFGVVQYSMKLATVKPAHRDVIRHWIDFTRAHRETLLKGTFRPHHPELMYPVIEAESAAERIVAVYSDRQVVPVTKKTTYVINASVAKELVLDLESGVSVRAFDALGQSIPAYPSKAEHGLVRLACPVSGYLRLDPITSRD